MERAGGDFLVATEFLARGESGGMVKIFPCQNYSSLSVSLRHAGYVGLLCSLRLSTASWSNVATSSPWGEASTASIFLEATTAWARPSLGASTPASHPATPTVVTSAVSVRARTAFLNVDLFASNLMGIGCNGGVVTFRIRKLDERAVLKQN